jgi:hypothetical protein
MVATVHDTSETVAESILFFEGLIMRESNSCCAALIRVHLFFH